jgi:phage-related protein
MIALKKVQARFYVSSNGRKPVREWLLGLTPGNRWTIGRDVQRVEFGWPLGMPYCRSLGKGLWEIRSDLDGGRIARVIFCFAGSDIVLLHGLIKKSQKTPDSELALAVRRMKDVER